MLRADQLDLGADEVGGRRRDEQRGDVGRPNDVLERDLADERVVDRELDLVARVADAARRVALRIEVDEQHAVPARRDRRGEVDRRRGLADAALLVRDSDDPGHGGCGNTLL